MTSRLIDKYSSRRRGSAMRPQDRRTENSCDKPRQSMSYSGNRHTRRNTESREEDVSPRVAYNSEGSISGCEDGGVRPRAVSGDRGPVVRREQRAGGRQPVETVQLCRDNLKNECLQSCRHVWLLRDFCSWQKMGETREKERNNGRKQNRGICRIC